MGSCIIKVAFSLKIQIDFVLLRGGLSLCWERFTATLLYSRVIMGDTRLGKTTKINKHTLLVFVLTTYLVVQGATYLTFDSETDNLAAMRDDAVFHRYYIENDGFHLFGSLTAISESHCGAHSLRINDGIQAFSFVEDDSSLGGDNCLLYKCVDVNKSSQLLQAGSTRMFVRQTIVFPNLALGKINYPTRTYIPF